MKNTVVTLFLLVSLVFTGTTARSQEKLLECAIVPYEKLDVKPRFELGEGEMFYNWLFSNVRYPQAAVDAGNRGSVMFSFIVSREGEVTDVKILSGEGILGEEIKRVMAMCPKWTPGELQGIKVGVRFIWNVDFSLRGDEKRPRITGQPVDPEPDWIIWEPDDWVYEPVEWIPYAIVHEKPTFKGGDLALFLEWVTKRLQYPADADGVKGRVTVRFRVTKEGDVAKVEVLRGLNEACDREAVKVVASSPKWEPGRDKKGAPVEVVIVTSYVFKPN